MRKGLSGIIVVLILLAVSVTLGGGFYLWSQGTVNNLKETAEETVQKDILERDSDISVVNIAYVATDTEITIKNTGKVLVPTSDFAVFINGELYDYMIFDNQETIDPGDIAILDVDFDIQKCDVVRVTGKNVIDESIYRDDGSC